MSDNQRRALLALSLVAVAAAAFILGTGREIPDPPPDPAAVGWTTGNYR